MIIERVMHMLPPAVDSGTAQLTQLTQLTHFGVRQNCQQQGAYRVDSYYAIEE